MWDSVLLKLLKAGCNPCALNQSGRTPSHYIQHSASRWVLWAKALLANGWDCKAVNDMVLEPVVPAADILDGTHLYYLGSGDTYDRSRRAVYSTRIEEVDDDATSGTSERPVYLG